MAKKLIRFEQKSDYYIQKGMEASENGDLLKALSLFFSAQEKSGDTEPLFHIAETYSDMDLYELSNATLYQILLREPENSAAGLMLARNFSMLGDTFREIYYLGKYSNVSETDEFATWLEDRLEDTLFSQVHPMTKATCEMKLLRIQQLLDRGRLEQARETLDEVLEYFPSDVQAQNLLTKFLLLEEMFADAVCCAQKVLDEHPDNVSALCNLSLGLYFSGEEQRADEVANRISKLKTAEVSDLIRLTRFFCFLERHEDIVVWSKKCLKEMPHEIDILLFLGIGCFNTGRFAEAKNVFLDMYKLRLSPVVVRYFLSQADKALEGEVSDTKLAYDFDIPATLKEDYFQRLRTMDYADLSDEDNELIHWGLTCADDETISCIAEGLEKNSVKMHYANLESALIAELPPQIKSRLLFRLFLGKRKKLYMVKDGYFTEVFWPNRVPPENVKRGYLLAYALLNCFTLSPSGFSSFYRAAKDLSERMDAQGYSAGAEQDGLIAATIIRNAGKEYLEDKYLCELLNVDYNILTYFSQELYA